MSVTTTHTSTHVTIDFADPYKTCNVCGGWITGVQVTDEPVDPVMPCQHRRGYSDVCPSWGPVDGCQCIEHLGYKPHAEPA